MAVSECTSHCTSSDYFCNFKRRTSSNQFWNYSSSLATDLVIVVTLILGVITAVLMATVNESKERTAHSEALAAAQAKIDKLTAENKQLTLRLNNKGKQKRAVAEQPTTPADK